MSTLATNAITDASGGNTATINSYTPTESNMAGRNRIINGDMRIAQRGTSAVTTNAAYPVDRWFANNVSAASFSAEQVQDAPAGFVDSLKYTVTTADASLDADDRSGVFQRIEGFNIADLGFGTANAKTVTVSFWVRSSLTGNFGGSITNSASDRSYPFTYSISVADTWEYKTVTIPGDTSGTWLTNNGVGVRLYFSVGTGSTRSGTAGSWQSGDIQSFTGATSIMSTLNATFYVTGVQLEAGSVATPFERRPYGTELLLCQRYACSTFPQGVAWGQNNGRSGLYVFTQSTSARVAATFKFPVSMRATPTIVTYNPSRAESGWENVSAGGNVAASVSTTSEGLSTDQAPVRTTFIQPEVNRALNINLSANAEL